MSTKINILSSLSKKADNLVIVGAMANNFLKFKGINVGRSLIEEVSENIVKNINTLAAKNKCNIIVPVDWNTSSSVNGDSVYKSLKDISKRWSLDKQFSPKVSNKFRMNLIKGWNVAVKRTLIT